MQSSKSKSSSSEYSPTSTYAPLLLSQRVSRHWRATITNPSLQRALFFQPVPAKDVDDHTAHRTRNPLLEEVFTPWFWDPDVQAKAAGSPTLSLYGNNYILENPLDALLQRKGVTVTTRAAQKKNDAFTRAGASWRRMLVQQPACEKLGFIQQTTMFWGQQSFSRAVLEFPLTSPSSPGTRGGNTGGVRMGDLYDLVYCFMGHRDSSAPASRSAGMQWPYPDTGTTPPLRYKVLWRVPRTEPALDPRYRQSGGYEVVLGEHMTPDVGIVVMQQGNLKGFEPLSRGSARQDEEESPYDEDGSGCLVRTPAGMRGDVRCDEFRFPRMKLESVFKQNWFG